MDIRQLGTMALIVVVAAVLIGVGSSVIGKLAENQCDTVSGTWKAYGVYSDGINGNNTANNPVTAAKYGCCQTANSTDCAAWLTSSHAINTSFKGMTGLTTFGNWIPLIALVIVASIVIGVIVRYMGNSTGSV